MSSFSIRNFLNRASRARSTLSGSTQGGSAGVSVGAASGPSSTTPTAASGPSSTTPTAASRPSSTTPTAASQPSFTTPTPTAASGPSSTTPTAASTSSSPYEGIIPPTLPPFPLIPCHDTVGQAAAVEEVCSFLEDVDVGIVGIYGMGGVGKTALMKIVHNKFLVGCDFHYIFWVVVSKDWNYERIRKGINIRILGSGGQNVLDEGVDAIKLYNFLLSKRFVLLLDVWEHLDWTELGIPIPTNTNMCKIIFTTRSQEMCRQMHTDREIKVDCLGPTDSWALFEKNVGEKSLKSHHTVAHQVMKECCGLPLALIIIGRAMSSKNSSEEWEYALEILQSNPHQMPGVEKKLFSCLEFSYLSLEDDTSRKCFLYCSLFPEDFSIRKEKLVDYWIGEGFLNQCENIKRLRNRGYHIIGGLLAAFLIENGTDSENEVKMHDVIRDMALWIVSDHGVKQNRFFVHPGHRLTTSEINHRWNLAERIFVWDLTDLPNSPSCLVLTTLIFHRYSDLVGTRYENVDKNADSDEAGIGETKIQINKGKVSLFNPDHVPDAGPSVSQTRGLVDLVSSLFHFMPILRLLDLSFVWFGDLPKSVTTLSMLRYLSSEVVDYLPHEIGRMSSLEIIDMRGFFQLPNNPTQLFSLQETVGQLLTLRMLSLKSMWFKSLPQNIELLCKLEILDLSYTPISVLPSTIDGLRELRQLLLACTALSGLPEKVVYLSKLEVIDLSFTKISALPSRIDRLSKLRFLYLNGTLLTDLPKDIFYLSMLKVLNLSKCKIKEHPNINPSSINLWQDKIGKTLDMIEVTKLETLDLSFTAIFILPKSISKFVELRHLNLESTLICTLPEKVMRLTKLEVLNLNSTKIKELPTSINQLQQLRELHLCNTLIQDLPTQLGELSNLEILSFKDVPITVPNGIYQMPKLRLVT